MGFLRVKKVCILVTACIVVVVLCMLAGNRMEKSVAETVIEEPATEVSREVEEDEKDKISVVSKEYTSKDDVSGEPASGGEYTQVQHEEKPMFESSESLMKEEEAVEKTKVQADQADDEAEVEMPKNDGADAARMDEETGTELVRKDDTPVISEENEIVVESSEECNGEEQKSGAEEPSEVIRQEQPWTEPIENKASEEFEEAAVCVHDFKKSIWENPTCMNGGYYNNICQKCGHVECVTLEPLPHESEDIVVQQGNCMEDTVIRHTCKNCGQQVKSDTRFTEQIHDWVTSIIDGEEITYCSRCGVAQ